MKPLTEAMEAMLKQVPKDWEPASGAWNKGKTLRSLESRGVVETRVGAGGWLEWRLGGAAEGAQDEAA